MASRDNSPAVARLPSFAGSIAAAIFLAPAGAAFAQDAHEAAPEVSSLTVKGQPPQGYAADQPQLAKLTESIVDTPQMIAVTPRQVIDDRGATSLTDVFRNSSGIAMAAGESSWEGTSLSIRGFNARNDIYLDGMRDFGSYTRDPFDLDEVELLQGPSSILFGRGSTGGVVNQVTKKPTLHGFLNVEGTGGTDDMARGTLDLDTPVPAFGDGVAFRFDAMAHTQMFTGRDVARYTRYGVAPSLALGLGARTRLTLAYLYQWEHDIPDYGLPYFRGAPAPVARNNFYGFHSDYLDTRASVATATLEHDFNDQLTLRDQLRYADYWSSWRDMEPQVNNTGVTPATPLSAINVNRALQGGVGPETFLENQADFVASFHTGGVGHHLAIGWELGRETYDPTYANGLGVPGTSLLNPNENQAFSGTVFNRIQTSTTAVTLGVYAIDTLKFGPHWELSGGVRWDRFAAHYVGLFFSNAAATLGKLTSRQEFHEVDEEPSWRGSLVYKPTPNGSLYFDYSTSFNPSAEALSEVIAVRSLTTGNIGLAPEQNQTFELGTKWRLADGRLQLQAAIFREEKENAREPDPANPQLNILAGDQRVNGAEAELAGDLTPLWHVSASYTYLDGKTVKTTPGGPPLGSPLFNAPRNSLALWTTYQVLPQLEVGGGLNYVSKRFASLTTSPFTSVPGYATLDLMAKWQATRHVRLQVNVNNLTDKFYYDALHGFHVVPGEGRTALFTVAYSN